MKKDLSICEIIILQVDNNKCLKKVGALKKKNQD